VRRQAFGVYLGTWWMLAVLWVLYAVSFLERYIVTMLVEPIKGDLSLSDFQMGLILGPAFAISYSLSTLPFGWAADRFSRRSVIVAGVTIWSFATMGAGIVRSFVGLFTSRVFVGVGEAALTPSAYALISDSFPQNRLTLAFAIFQTAVKAGSALAFVVGGALIVWATAHGSFALGALVLAPWQMVMVLAGLPSFLLVFLLFTFRVPKRIIVRDESGPQEALLPFLRQRKRLMGLIALGFTFISVCPSALTLWVPTFISRTYGWTPTQYGTALGIISLLAALTVVVKGALVDWLYGRGMRDAHVRFYCWLLIGAVPIAISAFFMPDARLFLGLYAVLQIVVIPYTFYVNAVLSIVVPAPLRGRVFAGLLFAFNFTGGAIGPVVVGFLTDTVFGSEAAIGKSLAVTLGFCMPAAFLCLWSSLGELRRIITETDEASLAPLFKAETEKA
jgi:MFS family permease